MNDYQWEVAPPGDMPAFDFWGHYETEFFRLHLHKEKGMPSYLTFFNEGPVGQLRFKASTHESAQKQALKWATKKMCKSARKLRREIREVKWPFKPSPKT